MDANNGKGSVMSKKNVLYNDTICDGHLTAVRHGNGRDWWVVNNGFQNNVLHKYLVTPDTILGPFFQAIGTPRLEPDAVGMACFSKDGSKFAIGTANSLINVFDFDRCTGIFSNPKTFQSITEKPWNNPYSNNSGCNGLSFSPNNRFLYVNSIYTIHQYDIEANDIKASGKLLAKYDSTFNQTSLPFEAQYLAPNQKIIVGNWDGSNANLHIIHSPDTVAPFCNFERDGIYVPYTLGASSLPNMPNYDLGKLMGCDTFYTAVSAFSLEKAGVKLFPNPASAHLTLQFTGNALLQNNSYTLQNTLGQVVRFGNINDNQMTIDVRSLPQGLYIFTRTQNGITKDKKKIIIQH